MQSDYVLLFTLGVLLVASPFVKSIMKRIGVPAPVGYIALGFLLGLLNEEWSFVSPTFETTFSVLGQVGVVGLLFRVGLKSHTKALLAKLPDASLIWVGDVLVNLLIGYLVSYYVLGFSVETSLVVTTALSATSIALSVGVWEELRMLNSNRGMLLVDVAELDDLSGVLLLAILLAVIPIFLTGSGDVLYLAGTTTAGVILKLLLFIAGCYLFSHYLEKDFTRLSRHVGQSKATLTIAILGAGLAIAALAGYLGFSLAIGALFAGFAFSRDPKVVHSDARFAYLYEFFTPFFFIDIGLQVDPGMFMSGLGMGMLLFVAAVLGKVIGVAVPALISMGRVDAVILGVSMIPRAEIALVIAYQCRQISDGIVPGDVYAAIVMVSVLTSIVAPLVLRPLLLKQANHQ